MSFFFFASQPASQVSGVKREEGGERGTRDGEAKGARVGGKEALEEGGFAGAGGAGDDDWGLWGCCGGRAGCWCHLSI